MISFETEYFQKFKFDQDQITRYSKNAFRDLEIARKDKFSEVRFTYSYQALIKAGIVLIAKTGQVRVRSVPGHHVKILEKMSKILQDTDILAIGDMMRAKRNSDFYSGGEAITEKEADDYFEFVKETLKKVENKIGK